MAISMTQPSFEFPSTRTAYRQNVETKFMKKSDMGMRSLKVIKTEEEVNVDF